MTADRSTPQTNLLRLQRRLACVMTVAAIAACAFLFFYARSYRGTEVPPRVVTAKQMVPSGGYEEASAPPIAKPMPRGHLTPKARPESKAATKLQPGDMLKTRIGERRRLILDDGSVLYVNEGSELKQTGPRRIELTKGEVYIEVCSLVSSKDVFTVSASGRELSALGKRFVVRAEEKGPAVLVAQGTVKVSQLDTALTAGQELVAGSTHIITAPRATHRLDWTRELMEAACAPLVPRSDKGGGALIAVDPNGQEVRLTLRKFHIDVHIEDGFARTTIDQTYFNNENWRTEGTFYFPLPPDASLSRLAMYVESGESCVLNEGGMAERNHARDVYETILHQRRDPALLEWVDGTTFKMRVFPLEGRKEKRILLSYTQRLTSSYGSYRYRFPAGHSMELVRDWSFFARIKHGADLRVSSLSHPDMETIARGGDLLVSGKAQAIKPDKDVVLEVIDNPSHKDQPRFSTSVHENHEYLLLRYRPELKSEARIQKRDWVILFETAANRDPLLARAQIEIVRHLLENAEAEDTFSVLSANTRVHLFDTKPRSVTSKNIDEAIAWLEGSHLVGALDLEKALDATRSLLKQGKQPHLVHIGAGFPALGERAAEELVKKVPDGTTYIGIGVGKRWNRAFMKQAAERTGGYFTQINPDEALNWRTFDLLATLNTPRLMDVRVTDAAGKSIFLTESLALTQGEEICAFTRRDAVKGEPLPATLVVSGLLDGKPYRRELKVEKPRVGADYLPRTWAKLEIDRLLADGAEKNRETITKLSLASYVMSPFTSLLVLETEEDYKRFKVDRGRKDHWAMYPCPDRIPVVHEPDARWVVWDALEINKGRKSPEAVEETLLGREKPRRFSRPALTETGLSDLFTTEDVNPLSLDFATDIFYPGERPSDVSVPGIHLPGERIGIPPGFSKIGMGGETLPMAGSIFGRKGSGKASRLEENLRQIRVQDDDSEVWAAHLQVQASFIINRRQVHSTDQLQQGLTNFGGREDSLFQDKKGWGLGRLAYATDLSMPSLPPIPRLQSIQKATFVDRLRKKRVADAEDYERRAERILESKWGSRTGSGVPLQSTRLQLATSLSKRVTDSSRGEALQFYGPRFTPRPSMFNDLTYYAPGLDTSDADLEAVLEREAKLDAPPFQGVIDEDARKLIDQARSAGWETITIGAYDRNPPYQVTFNGEGQFQIQRILSTGLREEIVCDGTHLWHIYRELGLAGRREFSRHHFGEIGDLVPWLVPSADDLAKEANVKWIGENVVALVPPAPVDKAKHAAEKQEPSYQVHLVFDKGRLSERRVVEAGKGTVLYRATYSVDGTCRAYNQHGDLVNVAQLARAKSTAPVLNVKSGDLLVLRFPLRQLSYLTRLTDTELSMPLYRDNMSRALAEDIFIAFCFRGHNVYQAANLFSTRFHSQGDKRLGFYVLLNMVGEPYHPAKSKERKWASELKSRLVESDDFPAHPTARYLNQNQKHLEDEAPDRFLVDLPRDSFLHRLAECRDLVKLWGKAELGNTSFNLLCERTLDFLNDCPEDEWAWSVVNAVWESKAMERGPRPETTAFTHEIAKVKATLTRRAGMEYASRYEYASTLFRCGMKDEARRQFIALHDDSFQLGILPPIENDFRAALKSAGKTAFADFQRERLKKLLADGRPLSAVLLGWQSYQMGEHALAQECLDAALTNTAPEDRGIVRLAGMEFHWHTGGQAKAEALLAEVLEDPVLGKQAFIWRLAARVAKDRGDEEKNLHALETAIDLEFQNLPEIVNLQAVREDYQSLLTRYDRIIDAHAIARTKPPGEWIGKVVRTADRWRSLDPENVSAPRQAATLLQKLGASELAWDYTTTPVGLRPGESEPWLVLAQRWQGEGNAEKAQHAFIEAFKNEPTNPDILWAQAAHLQSIGRVDQARTIYRRIAEGDWQPRFQVTRNRAKALR